MATEPVTKEAPATPETAAGSLRDEDTLRLLAREHLERVRKFKLHAAAYVVGIVVLGCIWAITEYQNSGGWPERLSEEGNAGDWNPWILWVILGWGFFVALEGINTYFRRPTTEAEIEREVERLKSRG